MHDYISSGKLLFMIIISRFCFFFFLISLIISFLTCFISQSSLRTKKSSKLTQQASKKRKFIAFGIKIQFQVARKREKIASFDEI
jgi:hypothetical protein